MAHVHPAYHGGKNHPEQVTDEYLSCRLCRHPGLLHPKILQCGHSFCRGCLDEYTQGCCPPGGGTFPCPTCSLTVPLPPGGAGRLPNNVFLATQVDRLLRRHNNAGTGEGRGHTFYNITDY